VRTEVSTSYERKLHTISIRIE